MKNPRMIQWPAIGIAVAVIAVALCCAAVAADLSAEIKPTAVDVVQYADFMAGEVLDMENLADFVEAQRQYFNRITPPGISWVQPMFPSVAPFDAAYFVDSFLDGLLGEDKYSVAVYPLSFALDPKTRETLVYNADGKLISVLPAVKSTWITTRGETDPARVTLQLDLLPVEDVEPYLYVEERVAAAASSASAKSTKGSKVTMKSLGVNEFGIAKIQTQTNGAMRITATNGSGTAEVFSFTVWHSNTVEVVTGSNGIPETNTIWWAASAPYNGVDETWDFRTTNLVFTNGVAVWEDADMPTNARQRMYSVALRTDTDGDGLTDGAEFFVYHTDPGLEDTDGDDMLDGWEVFYGLNPLSDDSLEDPDGDCIPNVYEQFHDINPTISDAASAIILRVDPAATPGSNIYSNLKAAFASSVPYSIVEVADGVYSGTSNTFLWFPAHPIMLCSDDGGTSRQTVFEYAGNQAAFYLAYGQNSRTIIKGLDVRLTGHTAYQVGFWLGPNMYWGQGGGASPLFDGVTVSMAESKTNIAFMCWGAASEPLVFNNCVMRGQPGESVFLRGICAVDSSPLKIVNCSFLNFPSSPHAYGVQLESKYMTETGRVDIVNCIWDPSFTASSPTPPFVRYKWPNAAPFLVNIVDSIMPATPTWFPPDTQTNLYITNALIALSGHLRTNSPGIDVGGLTLTLHDFEGQARDASPDIGADEYAPLGAGDSDGDGISDSSEVETYGTDPYRADSDSDGIVDGIEVADGTDPADPWSYRFEVRGVATNQTGNSSPVWICRRWGAGAWDTNTAAVATNGNFGLDILASNQPNDLYVGAFCDYNTNGLPDAVEPVYWKMVSATGSLMRTSFLLKDYDGDYLDDWQEVLCETDPFSASNYCFSVSGVFTNVVLESGNYYVGLSFTTNASDMFAVTNVGAGGTFAFSHIKASNSATYFYFNHFDDVNTNGVWDANELYGYSYTNRRGHSLYRTQEPRDYDNDDMPDFWEARQGLSWTNQTDCVEDPDGDEIYNVLEYQKNLNPWSANGSGNTAVRDAVNAVDSKLAGKVPSQALSIFTDMTTNFVRNTNCWAYEYDLTCCSPWNSTWYNGQAGTLISPQHVVFCAHWGLGPATNTILRFVDRDNNVVERRLIDKRTLANYSNSYPDLVVGLLDSPISNGVSYAKILPDNYAQYLSGGTRLPVVRLDQEEKALVGDVKMMSISVLSQWLSTCSVSLSSLRLGFYEDLVIGDSGNPVFIILSGEPVLLTVWTSGGAGSGSSIVAFKNEINQVMLELGGGYQLTPIDLSGFTAIGQ